MTHKPIDFIKVEALRKHMLLTTADMAELFGVSRVTYYGWVRGKPLRASNEDTVRAMLKRLLAVMTDRGWPTPEVIVAGPKHRKAQLLEILNQ
jgi:DNA-binding XRE family transcriptional regulator